MTNPDQTQDQGNSEQGGLYSQRNWRAALAGEPIRGASEYPLYSDARIVGERRDGFGPYAFMNAVPLQMGPGNVDSPLFVRVTRHFDFDLPDMSQRDESLYHGGLLVDELAALISLILGIRLRAGEESRRFSPNEDPLGSPLAGWGHKPPSMIIRESIPIELRPGVHFQSHRLVLPEVVGRRDLDRLDLLKSIPGLASKKYVSLIRAAMQYQDALWVAETEPHLAWLMLVSAIETAAGEHRSQDGSATERLRYSKPEVASVLDAVGGDDLVSRIAELIEPSLGATKKFIDFVLHYLPPEPAERPEPFARIEWERHALKKQVLQKVYAYRSRALHGGIPFPAPMSEPVERVGSTPPEKPLTGLATHSLGGTWMPGDVPINLHSFHYIARGAIINWWRSMVDESPIDEEKENVTRRRQ